METGGNVTLRVVGCPRRRAWEVAGDLSGGTTCLTVLVKCRFSSKEANNVANYKDP